MEEQNTAPSIQLAQEDDALQDDSVPSTPLASLSGAQTPLQLDHNTEPNAPVSPVIDELERFRSEWKKEVEARGHASYAQPPASSSGPKTQPTLQAASTSTAHQSRPKVPVRASDDPTASADTPPHQNISSVQDQDPSEHNDSVTLPFPEAEIYAPAALKYSKGAHKIPRSSAKQPAHDLPAPIIPAEYRPATSPSEPKGTNSVANGVSHTLRDRIKASANSLPPTASAQASSSTIPERKSAPRILATPDAPANATAAIQAGLRSAVEAYAHAVEMERSGQLDQALGSYRRAFKLNADADRLYHRAHLLLTDPALANTSTQQNDALLSSPAIADKIRKALDFDDHRYVAIKERQAKEAEALARGEVYNAAEPKNTLEAQSASSAAAQTGDRHSRWIGSRPDELTKLLENLSIEGGRERDFGAVAFAPEDEEKDMPIAKLPDEVLLHILRMVIQPRGRRGAKVVKPKPTPEEQAAMEAATAALTGKTALKPSADTRKPAKSAGAMQNGAQTESTRNVKAGAAVASTTSAATTDDAGKEETEKDKAQDSAVITRKQPLGIGVVLGGADWQTLEILGRTCWKFRLLTRSPSLWREIVRETYYPPILDASLTLADLYARHHSDWRTVFINQPRVRLNGCYIAACHYARPGLSEDAWVRVIHVVEFYRSIRFLPDGTALSLLTTDPPSETVRRLEPSLKSKGFSKGRWELFEQGLEDDEDEGRPIGPKVVVEDLRDKSMQKYAFRMVFGLRSTTRGRWNKLDLLEYYSVNLTNGEVLPLPQKHSRPFHFSRVLAYGV